MHVVPPEALNTCENTPDLTPYARALREHPAPEVMRADSVTVAHDSTTLVVGHGSTTLPAESTEDAIRRYARKPREVEFDPSYPERRADELDNEHRHEVFAQSLIDTLREMMDENERLARELQEARAR